VFRQSEKALSRRRRARDGILADEEQAEDKKGKDTDKNKLKKHQSTKVTEKDAENANKCATRVVPHLR
jgi:hypothetical protein